MPASRGTCFRNLSPGFPQMPRIRSSGLRPFVKDRITQQTPNKHLCVILCMAVCFVCGRQFTKLGSDNQLSGFRICRRFVHRCVVFGSGGLPTAHKSAGHPNKPKCKVAGRRVYCLRSILSVGVAMRFAMGRDSVLYPTETFHIRLYNSVKIIVACQILIASSLTQVPRYDLLCDFLPI